MKVKPVCFAIDYDATWTADPVAFAAFAQVLRSRGHRVLIVTARDSGHAEVERECGPHVDRVLLSRRTPKREYCEDNGERVNIWIDDRPWSVGPAPRSALDDMDPFAEVPT